MATRQEKIKKKFGKLSEAERNDLLSELGSSTTGADEKPKKGRKEKKVRDPNKPKKNMTAYLYYTQDRRSACKAENPELGPRDIVKKMGVEWNSMEESAKAPYVEKGNRSKERYDAAMRDYKA